MDYIDVCMAAAKKAVKIHKKYFERGIKSYTKSASFDLVTKVDTESEKVIVSTIKRHFPGHNFLAEENKYKKTPSEYTWIIDPLDGTNNFFCGIPIFSTSIALAKKDRVIAGVVYDVMRNEVFSAQKGKGAYLNGKRIRVNRIDSLNRSILITGLYYDRGKKMIEALENIKKFFFKRILGLRRFGSAALDLCYVACGRAAGFWEFELSPWDFAAGKLIVEEAGGKVTGLKGKKVDIKKRTYVIASNGKIHKKMLSVLNG